MAAPTSENTTADPRLNATRSQPWMDAVADLPAPLLLEPVVNAALPEPEPEPVETLTEEPDLVVPDALPEGTVDVGPDAPLPDGPVPEALLPEGPADVGPDAPLPKGPVAPLSEGPVALGDTMFVPWITKPFPMDVTVVQDVREGAGCASGVTGSPWWKVEVP